jgi:hypothetical protein
MARSELRPELRGICPPRMKSRPLDERGYTIPYFVGYVRGKPDFRCADPEKFRACVQQHKCWLCGEKLGVKQTFVIGPMCLINRVTSEPPCHLDCAIYAAKGCPFLKNPKAQYRAANLPADYKEPAGVGFTHNPTACALFTTKTWHLMRVDNGYLVRLGEPESVQFWHVGRIATRAEVIAAINVGLPKLLTAAREEGAPSVAYLRTLMQAAEFWLPVDSGERLELPA